mgnify:CR=1 FL=1
MVVGLLALVVVMDVKRRNAENQLAQLTVRLEQLNGGNNAQNLEAAKAIVAQVAKLMVVPTDIEPTVATIVDVEKLREQNEFYNQAENDDHLIVYPTQAILYRSTLNKIVAVVPVNVQAPTEAEAAAQATTSSAAVQAQQ